MVENDMVQSDGNLLMSEEASRGIPAGWSMSKGTTISDFWL
jgi:hypothetical protein